MATRRKTAAPVTAASESLYEPTSNEFRYCTMRDPRPRVFSQNVTGDHMEAIIVLGSKWVNGTVLHYYFFDKPSDGENVVLSDGSTQFRPWSTVEAEKDIVRHGFKVWMDIGIGLKFVEVPTREEAQVRIGFQRGDGAWSAIGRDILNYGKDFRTMNFGWDLVTYFKGLDTATHEIGHTLGLPHEHQNPNSGIVWNEPAVYADLASPPNLWSQPVTFHNIIQKIDPDTVQGSSWDPDSIMHYPFKAGLIDQPVKYRTQPLEPAGGLSDRDQTWIKTFYPAPTVALPGGMLELKPFQSVPMTIAAGQQLDFAIRPIETRYFEIKTFGHSDTVIVLFEDDNGTERYMTADDDSGEETNAYLKVKLVKDHKYILRARLYYANAAGQSAIMLW